MKFSFVIPYQYSPEREKLLFRCLNTLPIPNSEVFEVCIHEVGKNRTIRDYQIPQYKHMYTQTDGIFHRAWVLNEAVIKLTTSDMLILIDGDLVLTKEWLEQTSNCSKPSFGWGKIYRLSKSSTESYLKYKILRTQLPDMERIVHKPAMLGAAGGATIIPRDIFFEVAGMPEDFEGTWGGEDNAFALKLDCYGYPLQNYITAPIYHLYHDHKTVKNPTIQKKIKDMKSWNLIMWEENSKHNEYFEKEIKRRIKERKQKEQEARKGGATHKRPKDKKAPEKPKPQQKHIIRRAREKTKLNL